MSAIMCHHRFRPLLCFLFLCGLCLVVPPPAGAVDYGDQFFDDFNGGIDFSDWKIVSNQPLFRVDNSDGDVFLAKPLGGRGWGHHDIASLCFKGHLVGAFDISVEFSDASLAIGDTGCNTASLDLFFGAQLLNVVRQECEEGGDTVGVWLEPQEFWAGFEVADSGGILRVARDEYNAVTTYFNETPLHTDAFNGAAVTELCLSLGNHLSLDAISVRFDEFNVWAQSIQYPDEEWREVISAPAVDGQGATAIAFHPSQPEVAIAYTDPATEEVRVVRGVRTGIVWLWQEPEVAADEGRAVDLAYDPCGRLWISYLSGPSNKGYVRLAEWDGSAWIEHAVDRGGKRWATSIAPGPSGCGRPSLTYGVDSGSEGQLRFAEGELPPVVVDSGAADVKGESSMPSAGVGSFSSLAYAADGDPAVAYTHIDESGCSSVRFASREDGVWDTNIVASRGADFLGDVSDVSLAHGADGRALIAFAAQPLVFCERPEVWSCSILFLGPTHMWDWGHVLSSSVMVDADGTVIIGTHIYGLNFEDEFWLYRRPIGQTEWEVDRVRGFPVEDGALDPDGNPAFSYWGADGVMFAYLQPIGCATTCDDDNPCTYDACVDGACTHTAVTDGTSCEPSPDVCCCGACVTPWCSEDADCDDGDPCTADSCVFADFPCDSYCEHTPIPDCGGCVPTASKEKGPRCTDGLDNDCDGMIDGKDPDC